VEVITTGRRPAFPDDVDVFDPFADAARELGEPSADERADGPVELVVLDIGGVLLSSAMPKIVSRIAELSGRSEMQLWRFFNTRLFRRFWGGTIDVDAFWAEMANYAGVPRDTVRDRVDVADIMLPLPALARVPDWAARTRVGVLSNQRAEWVVPVFARAEVLHLIDPLLLSDRIHAVKPEPAMFRTLAELDVPAERVLYVDDRAPALRRAEAFGVRTLEAVPDGRWMDRLDAMIGVAA
jgi:FMN phosphatase YigB (HAD superfamily)